MKKLYALIISLLAILCLQAQNKQPNILFIIADDLSPKIFETNEDRQIEAKTPNLDALAEQSTIFENTHIMGSWTGAVCLASRTSLNTGYSIWKANVIEPKNKLNLLTGEKTYSISIDKKTGEKVYSLNNNKSKSKNKSKGKDKPKMIDPAENIASAPKFDSWASLMKDAGYYTYQTGKWHVNCTSPENFDKAVYSFGGMFSGTPKYGYNRPMKGVVDKWNPSDPSLGGFWIKDDRYPKEIQGKHATNVTADAAIDFLKTYENDKPFFAYIAFNAPHDPRQAPKEYMDMYDLEAIDVPANFMPENPNAQAGGVKNIRDENLAPYPRTHFAVKTHRKEYYAAISYLDYHIGRILKALDETELDRETIVIFTADHGLAIGEHGYMGKQNMYEASIRTPLFIKGGGFKSNTKIKSPIYMQDIMPTTIEIAGGDVPEAVDYKSLMPFIKDEEHKQYDSIYASFMDAQKMLKKDGFKLIHYKKSNVYLFFNINEDPEELNDLIKDPKYKDKITEFKKELKDKDNYFKALNNFKND